MDEHVLAAVFRGDESETLCRVEELNLTDHYGFLLNADDWSRTTPRRARHQHRDLFRKSVVSTPAPRSGGMEPRMGQQKQFL
jgi:hypothetical protein